jgi:hypothetical protein
MNLAVHVSDEFPIYSPLFVIPSGPYAVLNSRFENLGHLREVITTLPIARGAVIRGSRKDGYQIWHSPKGEYISIADIEILTR